MIANKHLKQIDVYKLKLDHWVELVDRDGNILPLCKAIDETEAIDICKKISELIGVPMREPLIVKHDN